MMVSVRFGIKLNSFKLPKYLYGQLLMIHLDVTFWQRTSRVVDIQKPLHFSLIRKGSIQ
jgi:hypothetical protein